MDPQLSFLYDWSFIFLDWPLNPLGFSAWPKRCHKFPHLLSAFLFCPSVIIQRSTVILSKPSKISRYLYPHIWHMKYVQELLNSNSRLNFVQDTPIFQLRKVIKAFPHAPSKLNWLWSVQFEILTYDIQERKRQENLPFLMPTIREEDNQLDPYRILFYS